MICGGVDLKKNGYTAMIFGIGFFVLLFIFSEKFLEGLNLGLVNCVRIVIPSVFPFLIASSLAGSGEIPKRLKKILNPITEFLFRLPAESITAILLGLFGGYLSGAKAAQSLLASGSLNKNQTDKLMLFCINAGIGFSVNAVGNAMLCSREAGKVLLLSLCISSLITGVLSGFLPEAGDKPNNQTVKTTPPFSVSFVNGVNSASHTMLAACGFVALFSGIGTVADSCIKNETVRLILSCLLEVTKGCADITGKASLPTVAAVCAFGGICVHLQIFSMAHEVKIHRFYAFRIIHSLTAYISCRIIIYFYPVERAVFLSISKNAAAFSFSAPAAISLLFLSFLLILDLDNNKKIC